jgi:hypothetical protein
MTLCRAILTSCTSEKQSGFPVSGHVPFVFQFVDTIHPRTLFLFPARWNSLLLYILLPRCSPAHFIYTKCSPCVGSRSVNGRNGVPTWGTIPSTDGKSPHVGARFRQPTESRHTLEHVSVNRRKAAPRWSTFPSTDEKPPHIGVRFRQPTKGRPTLEHVSVNRRKAAPRWSTFPSTDGRPPRIGLPQKTLLKK